MNSRKKRIFIMGMPRGGTTMLRLCINRLDGVFILPETDFFIKIWGARKRLPKAKGERISAVLRAMFSKNYRIRDYVDSFDCIHERVLAITGDEPSELEIFDAIMSVIAEHEGVSCYGEKSPIHSIIADQFVHAFPADKIVGIVREPCPAIASFLKRPDMSDDIYHVLAYMWLANAKLRSLAGQGKIHLIVYEDFLEDPRGRLHELCEYLGVGFQEDMLYPGSTSAYDQNGGQLINEAPKPIKNENSQAWRSILTDVDVDLIERAWRARSVLQLCFVSPRLFARVLRLQAVVMRARLGVMSGVYAKAG